MMFGNIEVKIKHNRTYTYLTGVFDLIQCFGLKSILTPVENFRELGSNDGIVDTSMETNFGRRGKKESKRRSPPIWNIRNLFQNNNYLTRAIDSIQQIYCNKDQNRSNE